MDKKPMWQLIVAGLGMVVDMLEGGLELLEAKAEAEELKVISETKQRMQSRADRMIERVKKFKKITSEG